MTVLDNIFLLIIMIISSFILATQFPFHSITSNHTILNYIFIEICNLVWPIIAKQHESRSLNLSPLERVSVLQVETKHVPIMIKNVNRKIQEGPQLQTAANPWHQEEEKKDKN